MLCLNIRHVCVNKVWNGLYNLQYQEYIKYIMSQLLPFKCYAIVKHKWPIPLLISNIIWHEQGILQLDG